MCHKLYFYCKIQYLLQFDFDRLSRGRAMEAQLSDNMDLFGLGRGPSKDGRSHAWQGLFNGNLKNINPICICTYKYTYTYTYMYTYIYVYIT